MEFNMDGITLGITAGFYLLVMALTWRFPTGFPLPQKLAFSIIALPLIYIMVNWQWNKE